MKTAFPVAVALAVASAACAYTLPFSFISDAEGWEVNLGDGFLGFAPGINSPYDPAVGSGALEVRTDGYNGDDVWSSVLFQSEDYTPPYTPGVGKLGDYSDAVYIFSMDVYVSYNLPVGPGGVLAEMFIKTGDYDNPNPGGGIYGWDYFGSGYTALSHGWNTLSISSAGIPGMDILQAVGVQIGMDKDVICAQFYIDNVRATAVPEPSAWALIGTGLLGVVGVAHRRR